MSNQDFIKEESWINLKNQYQLDCCSAKFQSVYAKNNPLISVCIATFNRADLLLSRSLKSILNQSYYNLQIIIVGDCVTDDTPKLLAGIKDSRIIFENLTSRGPYPKSDRERWYVAGTNAMNRAMELAEGDFVTHLDDDDLACSNRVESLVESALTEKSEFIWHPFFSQRKDGTWFKLGSEDLAVGHVTTGSIFYHQFFKDIKWDVFAYLQQEPGDWNRIKKIKALNPRLSFLNKELLFHYREQGQSPFKALHGETFL